uniref:Putative glycosyl hydrolase family5 n=1 Tax=uncultured symbiotic protist of Cryptocercus punctulatus TaxID=403662 RepID=A4UX51_9EUKA|nr:putative glycosyl hydrolase family5 [uncultured symbiotic protist of Cryptocercus punctulatus]
MLLFLLSRISVSWLSTSGSKITDGGQTVRLTGVNWFGYETSEEVFHGLWAAGLHDLVQGVSQKKFNTFRVPISASVLQDWKAGKPNPKPNINLNVNADLEGLNNQQIFDLFLADCKKYKIYVFIDVHGVTDGSYMDNLWYTSAHPAEWIYSALEWFADHYKGDQTIIGIDIKNEPHGRCEQAEAAKWSDSKDNNNWKYFIETAAARILGKNPNLLILVEGIECYNNNWGWWGGNLIPVNDYPINLGSGQKQLVYSPHEYGPSVNDQSWFKSGFNYDSLYADHWQKMWMFIIEKNIAPILIGEWGGHVVEPNTTWMKALVQLISKYGLSQTFWCLNPDSGDTGGLLENDWITWDTAKLDIIKGVL